MDLKPELSAWFLSAEVQDQLKKLMSEAVGAKLSEVLDSEVLTAAEAATFLSMTEGAVRKAAERGQIPCFRIGRRLRFRRSDLLNLDR